MVWLEVQPAMRQKKIIMFLIMLLCVTSAHAQLDERIAKVAYIYNFLRLTEWPVLLEQPFNLCILGYTALDEQLYSLEGKQVRSDVSIMVRHISMDAELDSCHAIYLDGSKRKHIDMFMRKLQGVPALTISDAEGLSDRGIMIEINTLSNRLAFEINLKAAHHAKMNFSARLLKLARFVTTL
jgi:hypothetical protein